LGNAAVSHAAAPRSLSPGGSRAECSNTSRQIGRKALAIAYSGRGVSPKPHYCPAADETCSCRWYCRGRRLPQAGLDPPISLDYQTEGTGRMTEQTKQAREGAVGAAKMFATSPPPGELHPKGTHAVRPGLGPRRSVSTTGPQHGHVVALANRPGTPSKLTLTVVPARGRTASTPAELTEAHHTTGLIRGLARAMSAIGPWPRRSRRSRRRH